jgi:hypothetical protein
MLERYISQWTIIHSIVEICRIPEHFCGVDTLSQTTANVSIGFFNNLAILII